MIQVGARQIQRTDAIRDVRGQCEGARSVRQVNLEIVGSQGLIGLKRVERDDAGETVAGRFEHRSYGLRSPRHRRVVVLADERRHGGGDLRLSHWRDVVAFSERRRIGSDDRDPDVLRALLLDAVLLPLGEAAAATMVGGDDEGRLVPVFGHRLHRVPELLHEEIEAMRAVEHQVVSALMRPIVGLAIADEQDARFRGDHIVEQRYLQEGVRRPLLVDFGQGLIDPPQQRIACALVRLLGRRPARLHHQTAALLVEDLVECVPGSVDRHSTLKFVEFVKPLEHRRVRVGAELVAVDGRVRKAGGHLVVSGVREGHSVDHLRDAPHGLIAEDLPALRHRSPQEREQRRPPLALARSPIALAQILLREPAAARRIVEQILLGAGEYFLPAQSVADDQHHVLRLGGECCARAQQPRGTRGDYADRPI